MINFVKGNIFDSRAQVLVSPVNCVGVMDKGLAKQFKDRYPDMFTDYKNICVSKTLKIGMPYLWKGKDRDILLFPTKDDYREPSKIQDIYDGLKWFFSHFEVLGIKSIAFPALGCGCGGLKWSDVKPLMIDVLDNIPIQIEIYEP